MSTTDAERTIAPGSRVSLHGDRHDPDQFGTVLGPFGGPDSGCWEVRPDRYDERGHPCEDDPRAAVRCYPGELQVATEWPPRPRDAADRAEVRTTDGRTGTLVYVRNDTCKVRLHPGGQFVTRKRGQLVVVAGDA